MLLDVTVIVTNRLEFHHKAACSGGMAHRSWHQRDPRFFSFPTYEMGPIMAQDYCDASRRSYQTFLTINMSY